MPRELHELGGGAVRDAGGRDLRGADLETHESLLRPSASARRLRRALGLDLELLLRLRLAALPAAELLLPERRRLALRLLLPRRLRLLRGLRLLRFAAAEGELLLPEGRLRVGLGGRRGRRYGCSRLRG